MMAGTCHMDRSRNLSCNIVYVDFDTVQCRFGTRISRGQTEGG